jgi:hypothetical protein
MLQPKKIKKLGILLRGARQRKNEESPSKYKIDGTAERWMFTFSGCLYFLLHLYSSF